MRSGHRSSACWGVLATLALHGVLWGAFKLAARHDMRSDDAAPGQRVLAVRLLPAPSPVGAVAAPAPAGAVAAAAAVRAEPAVRDAIRYYFPEEVDRELELQRDRSDDEPIALPYPVVLHLFVDAGGRVNAVEVEDGTLDPALQEQLRKAFMTLAFTPAQRRGRAVAARIRIEVSPPP